MTPDERKKINVILAAYMEPKPTWSPLGPFSTVSDGGWWTKTWEDDPSGKWPKQKIVPAHDCTTDLNDGMRVAEKYIAETSRGFVWPILELSMGTVTKGKVKTTAKWAGGDRPFYQSTDPAEALALACVEVVESLKENGK